MAPHVAFLDKAVSVRPGCVCVWKTGAEERGGVSHSCPGYRGSVETKQYRGVAHLRLMLCRLLIFWVHFSVSVGGYMCDLLIP